MRQPDCWYRLQTVLLLLKIQDFSEISNFDSWKLLLTREVISFIIINIKYYEDARVAIN